MLTFELIKNLFMYKYLFMILFPFLYFSNSISQNYIKVELDHFESIYYDSNGNAIEYDILPSLCHIDNDTIYFSISEMNKGVKIWKFINDKFIDKIEIISDDYLYFDFIINGIEYIRMFYTKKDINKTYFINKRNFSSNNKLENISYINLNKYLVHMAYNSSNYSNYEYKNHIMNFDYNNEIRKIGLDTIPISIYPIQDAVQFYNDNGQYKVLTYSLKHAIIFPIETNTWINDELRRIKIRRNTIFAYYGRTFKTDWLQEYFNSQFWYKPNPNYSDEMLNEFDKEEIQILLRMEKEIELNHK